MPAFTRDEVPGRLLQWLPSGSSLTFPEQGMTSTVAFVEPGQVALKRCTDPLYLDWLRREREVLLALESVSLPVPRVLDHLDSKDDVWLVMTRLPGSSCSTALERSDRAELRALLARIGVFLRRLHETPVPRQLVSRAANDVTRSRAPGGVAPPRNTPGIASPWRLARNDNARDPSLADRGEPRADRHSPHPAAVSFR